MPKVRRVQSPSIDNCTRSHAYPSSSKNVELHKPSNLMGSVEDLKEWEEARCPICMEPPHNAVLLKCSSHEKGCRPYMCNTSYRHSNCLDQFCKSFASHLSSAILQEIPLTGTTTSRRSSEVHSEPVHPSQWGSHLQLKVVCPLCRGEIYGYMVLEPARRYMNSKPRSCSSETCEFQGTYSELRKHARSEHPSVRPSEVDPSRQRDWIRMEQERDFEDLFSSIHASSDTDLSTDAIFTEDFADFMTLFWYEIFSSIEEANQITSLLANSRHRLSLHDRRSGIMQRLYDDTETNQSATWRTSLPLMHQMDRIRTSRWRTTISSSHDNHLEINRTARWRTNLLSSRTPRELQYYREGSSRMPQASQQTPETNSAGSNSSSGRTPRHHQLRWRDQRWLRYNNQP